MTPLYIIDNITDYRNNLIQKDYEYKEDQKTLENNNKATWKMNAVYDTGHILCNRRNSAKNPDEGRDYAGIWQELGLAESEECTAWAKSIVL